MSWAVRLVATLTIEFPIVQSGFSDSYPEDLLRDNQQNNFIENVSGRVQSREHAVGIAVAVNLSNSKVDLQDQ